jgi:N-acetylglucosamine-6-phosphate deacetylase
MLLIRNATVITPEITLEKGAVLVQDGRITAVAPTPELPIAAGTEVIDAEGLFLTPGFIDLQCNGGWGHDFSQEPGSIWQVARRLPQTGVTSFLPTMVSSPLATVAAAQALWQAGPPAGWSGAQPMGLHLEGPFLNPAKKGAHNPVHLRLPDPASIGDWRPDRGVRLVTLAPELPRALDVIGQLSAQEVIVSAGHSLADNDTAQKAIEAGVRYGTHLFNAMPPLLHREPGLAGALLNDERVTVGLIADAVHVHPTLVKLVWQMLGSGRLNLVTDAMAALGMPPGRYHLGDFQVTVDEGSARLPNGTLAGSVMPLATALQCFRRMTGCSLAAALPLVTTTPARLLGLAHDKGRIAPGYAADLLLLDDNGRVRQSWVAATSTLAKSSVL